MSYTRKSVDAIVGAMIDLRDDLDLSHMSDEEKIAQGYVKEGEDWIRGPNYDRIHEPAIPRSPRRAEQAEAESDSSEGEMPDHAKDLRRAEDEFAELQRKADEKNRFRI